MRLKYSFEMMKLDDQIVAVPVGDKASEFHGVIKLNETAAAILELLKEETVEEAIIKALENEYEVDRDTLTKDVYNILTEFKDKGMLV